MEFSIEISYLLFLKNINSKNFDDYLIYIVYDVMISTIIISFVLRWIFKNEWMIIEQYIIAVNKKEEEIVEEADENSEEVEEEQNPEPKRSIRGCLNCNWRYIVAFIIGISVVIFFNWILEFFKFN